MNRSLRLTEFFTRSPILWGLAAAGTFLAMVHAGVFGEVVVPRYCIGHPNPSPIAYLETTMFFLGMAALVLKAIDLVGQYAGLRRPPLEADGENSSDEDSCDALLDCLDGLPNRRQREYYVGRLRAAVEYVHRRGSAEALDDELRYLADADAGRAHTSYGLFRVIVWAIPILGFLGTVIGITMALNGVDLQAPDKSMVHVLTGLGLKFDTTALALTLSMVLMFVHFLVDRAEGSLLEQVDAQVMRDVAGLFARTPAGPEGQVTAVRRMAETMVHAVQRLVERQTDLWRASMESAQQRWAQFGEEAGEQIQAALAESLKVHAREIAAAEQAASENNRRQWSELHQALGQNVQSIATAQETMVRRVEVLNQAVEATGQIARLEETLNHNLAALAGAKNFEETVISLAAAIHLLTARVAEPSSGAGKVRLESPRHSTRAA